MHSNDIEQLQVIPFDESKQVTNSTTEYQNKLLIAQRSIKKQQLYSNK
ncbi:Uncharacterised protein [Orientia tsutsugamushi]|nr:hypothetical protein [Orientia tsutsugamushi]KJV75291.1 hypothetical protein OTSTA763_0544 [Orientia tsutsugamushi str. TA763]SPP25389.1 Uncharacterised protein [Orientia tsutsugamushi]